MYIDVELSFEPQFQDGFNPVDPLITASPATSAYDPIRLEPEEIGMGIEVRELAGM